MEHVLLILSTALSLFILMDAIGNIPLFLTFLKDVSPKRQRWVILREMLIALGIIIAFTFLGDYILAIIGVSQDAAQVSGSIILFLIALRMIFPSQQDYENDNPHEREPFIVPLAIPFVAGPAVIAAVMLYSHQQVIHRWSTILAILIAWSATTVILICSSSLQKILGRRGIIASERLMGLVLTLIAVEMFLKGISAYFNLGS
jgi:multiple antibiotic resistance protein